MKIAPAWKPAAVVFDCDGLLVDTETCWAVAESELFSRAGLSFGPEQKALLIGKSVAEEAREIAKTLGGNSNARDIEVELSIAADEARAPKPAPDMYLEACSRLGVAPGQALAFEDSMTGVLAAKAAGMKVICIPTLQGLEYPADAVCDSLADGRLLSWVMKWT